MAFSIHWEGSQSHLSGKGWLSKICLGWLMCWGMSPKKLGVRSPPLQSALESGHLVGSLQI